DRAAGEPRIEVREVALSPLERRRDARRPALEHAGSDEKELARVVGQTGRDRARERLERGALFHLWPSPGPAHVLDPRGPQPLAIARQPVEVVEEHEEDDRAIEGIVRPVRVALE